jgi:hypothetical protein
MQVNPPRDARIVSGAGHRTPHPANWAKDTRREERMTRADMFGLAASLALLIAPGANAQSAASGAKRTDLNGMWTNVSLTGLNRPAGVDKLVLTPEEAATVVAKVQIAGFAPEGAPVEQFSDPNAGAPEKGAADFGVKAYDQFWVAPGDRLAVVKGEIRSSYIVDPPNGRMPIRAEVASARARSARYATGVGGNEGPESPPLSERCLIGFGNTGGPGMLSTLYNNHYQIVQAPDHVMILVEMVHDARIIPTFASAEEARRHRKPAVMSPWLGDSVGWYDGATLVVETVNIRPDQVRVSSIPISATGKAIERFTRVSDKEIFYEFLVEDEATYTQPWRAELSFYATDARVWEYACHEGNYAMANILGGARLQERLAAGPAATR